MKQNNTLLPKTARGDYIWAGFIVAATILALVRVVFAELNALIGIALSGFVLALQWTIPAAVFVCMSVCSCTAVGAARLVVLRQNEKGEGSASTAAEVSTTANSNEVTAVRVFYLLFSVLMVEFIYRSYGGGSLRTNRCDTFNSASAFDCQWMCSTCPVLSISDNMPPASVFSKRTFGFSDSLTVRGLAGVVDASRWLGCSVACKAPEQKPRNAIHDVASASISAGTADKTAGFGTIRDDSRLEDTPPSSNGNLRPLGTPAEKSLISKIAQREALDQDDSVNDPPGEQKRQKAVIKAGQTLTEPPATSSRSETIRSASRCSMASDECETTGEQSQPKNASEGSNRHNAVASGTGRHASCTRGEVRGNATEPTLSMALPGATKYTTNQSTGGKENAKSGLDDRLIRKGEGNEKLSQASDISFAPEDADAAGKHDGASIGPQPLLQQTHDDHDSDKLQQEQRLVGWLHWLAGMRQHWVWIAGGIAAAAVVVIPAILPNNTGMSSRVDRGAALGPGQVSVGPTQPGGPHRSAGEVQGGSCVPADSRGDSSEDIRIPDRVILRTAAGDGSGGDDIRSGGGTVTSDVQPPVSSPPDDLSNLKRSGGARGMGKPADGMDASAEGAGQRGGPIGEAKARQLAKEAGLEWNDEGRAVLRDLGLL